MPLAAGGVRKWLLGSLKCRTQSRISPTKKKSYVTEDIVDSGTSKFEFAKEKGTIWGRIPPIRMTRIIGRRRGEGDEEDHETASVWEDSARQCHHSR